MAQVKYGALVTELKGKIGGTVFQKSTAGFIAKNKQDAKLMNSIGGSLKMLSAKMGIQLSFVSKVAQAWAALTDVQRNSFVAGAVNFPFKNKFGETYTASGFQVFMQLNLNQLFAGEAMFTTCPDKADSINPVSFTAAWDPSGTFILTPTIAPSANTYTKVEACYGSSKGRALNAGRLKTVFGGKGAITIDIWNGYSALFGAFAAGSRIWVRLTYINTLDGTQSTPAIGYVDIPA